ncbi:hypothetical protein [Egicoccus halophilus]|uniref:Uncharacterized protein n=1 Tax=Egicoccus halophilus TaxID=1670830 RepID=A0A8J3AD23_9ACTN|nr:hypothetical protein [Egicoccus halophilus]GGI09171.1 hypothetical protein GCM10011354_32750 [Egicoccus halophilus]
MAQTPRDFEALDGIRQHQVADALMHGRAVEDPELAAITVARARVMRRTIMGFAAGLAVTALVSGLAVRQFGDRDQWAGFVAVGTVFGILLGIFLLHMYAGAVRAEKESNALLGVGQGAGPPSAAERLGAAGLALFTGLMTSNALGMVVFVAARVTGREIEQVSSLWNIPPALAGLAVAGVCYRAILSRTDG